MTSTTRSKNRHRVRCYKKRKGKACGCRFVLRHHPDWYIRAPKCPRCGSTRIRSVEADRRREVDKQDSCTCYNYPFPHRKGSLRMCIHHPLFIIGCPLNEEEEYTYQKIWETPRSS